MTKGQWLHVLFDPSPLWLLVGIGIGILIHPKLFNRKKK